MDEQGFTEWVAGRQRQLLRSAYLLTGDLHRAEDLVQDALTKVALRWSRLADGNPTAYALRIIARDNITWWRRRRDVLGVSIGTVKSQNSAALARLRTGAPELLGQRAVLVLRHFDDLTERETADVLGVSIGTVKSQNAAALARLRTGAPELLTLIGRTP